MQALMAAPEKHRLLLRQSGGTASMPLEEAGEVVVQPKDRKSLELATVGRIAQAFTAFGNATQAHARSIKDAAKAQAETYALVIDIATGFLAPVFANFVASKMIAKASAAGVAQTTQKAMVNLITRQDALKAAFTGATKIAGQVIKANSNALFGESEIDAFALALRNSFQRGADALMNGIGAMSDPELIAVWVAYDPEFADESAYRASLARLFSAYQEQVEPLGPERITGDVGGSVSSTHRLYYIQMAGGRTRLAHVLESTVAHVFGSTNKKLLWSFVNPEMQSIALAKEKALGRTPPTIPLKDLESVTLPDLVEPPLPKAKKEEYSRKKPLEFVESLSDAERRAAAASPDFMHVLQTQKTYFGWRLSDDDRYKAIYRVKGYSRHVVKCIEAMEGPGTNEAKLFDNLRAMDPDERARLGKEQWFVDRLKYDLDDDEERVALPLLGLPGPPVPQRRAPASYEPVLPVGPKW